MNLVEELTKEVQKLREQNQTLTVENLELKGDIKQIKKPLVRLCIMLGFINEDMTVNENFRVGKLLSKLSGLLLSPNGMASEFGFLQELFPLFQKYKNIGDE